MVLWVLQEVIFVVKDMLLVQNKRWRRRQGVRFNKNSGATVYTCEQEVWQLTLLPYMPRDPDTVATPDEVQYRHQCQLINVSKSRSPTYFRVLRYTASDEIRRNSTSDEGSIMPVCTLCVPEHRVQSSRTSSQFQCIWMVNVKGLRSTRSGRSLCLIVWPRSRIWPSLIFTPRKCRYIRTLMLDVQYIHLESLERNASTPRVVSPLCYFICVCHCSC